MSDWLEKAKMTLYDLALQQNAVDSIPEMIEVLENEAYGIKAAQTDKIIVSGGGTANGDDKIVTAISKLEELRYGLSLATMESVSTTKALHALTDEEQTILRARYIDQLQGWEDYLIDVLHIERATVYRKLRRSLRRYCIARFGTY